MEFLPSIELISNNLVVIVDECLDFLHRRFFSFLSFIYRVVKATSRVFFFFFLKKIILKFFHAR